MQRELASEGQLAQSASRLLWMKDLLVKDLYWMHARVQTVQCELVGEGQLIHSASHLFGFTAWTPIFEPPIYKVL